MGDLRKVERLRMLRRAPFCPSFRRPGSDPTQRRNICNPFGPHGTREDEADPATAIKTAEDAGYQIIGGPQPQTKAF
jgi:hypothetical protein